MTYEEVLQERKDCEEGNNECSDCKIYNEGCSCLRAVLEHEKQSVREFAERFKEKIDKIKEHCFEMHNWQGQSAVCEVEENIDELLAEVTG